MLKNRINWLKIIECFLFLNMFFIILYDAILPKHYADKIYEFGIMQFGLLTTLFWVLFYFSVGIHEIEYIKAKFNKKHLSRAMLGICLCIVLYLKIYF